MCSLLSDRFFLGKSHAVTWDWVQAGSTRFRQATWIDCLALANCEGSTSPFCPAWLFGSDTPTQIRPLWVTQKTRHFSSSQTSSHCDRRCCVAVISCNTSYVTYPPRHSPPPSFRFFYSNKNHLVQLEATTIQTERGSSMQHTKRMTVAHHRSDFIHHVTRADWQEEWGEEEWGSTDKKSESRQTRSVRARQTRSVRRDRQEEWGETDKKSEARQKRKVRRDRQEESGEKDKKSEVRQTRRVRRDRQEEWCETGKKSEVRQTRRVRRDRQEEWCETDKKIEARQTRRWGETEKKS